MYCQQLLSIKVYTIKNNTELNNDCWKLKRKVDNKTIFKISHTPKFQKPNHSIFTRCIVKFLANVINFTF